MSTLVTGGAGFIGSNIVDELVRRSEKVIIVDDLSTGKKENINKKAKFYKMNICNPSIKKIFYRERPDIVIHLAAQMNVRESVKDPIFDAQTNILGSLNILENCVKSGVKKIIFASSGGAIYGEGGNNLPARESFPPSPLSPYGIAKLSVEHYLHYYQYTYGLEYTILRYGNVYGERQDPLGEAGVIAIFIRTMFEGKNPVIYGDGEQLRDYVYVGDVVRATLLAIKKGKNQIFNIGTGRGTSVNTLYNKLKNLISFSGNPVYASPRAGDILRNYLDISRAKKYLNWYPRVSLDQGLQRTIRWFSKTNL